MRGCLSSLSFWRWRRGAAGGLEGDEEAGEGHREEGGRDRARFFGSGTWGGSTPLVYCRASVAHARQSRADSRPRLAEDQEAGDGRREEGGRESARFVGSGTWGGVSPLVGTWGGATPLVYRCGASMAHLRQSRPDSVLGFQVNVRSFPSRSTAALGDTLAHSGRGSLHHTIPRC